MPAKATFLVYFTTLADEIQIIDFTYNFFVYVVATEVFALTSENLTFMLLSTIIIVVVARQHTVKNTVIYH